MPRSNMADLLLSAFYGAQREAMEFMQFYMARSFDEQNGREECIMCYLWQIHGERC